MSFYNYGPNNDQGPTPSHTLAFIVLYAIFTVAHVLISGWSRKWWLIGTVGIFGALEAAGWGCRYGNTDDKEPDNMTLYAVQSAFLVISPCFFTAFIYVQLGVIISYIGSKFSLLRPKFFGAIFITVDVISILIQAAGGGISSSNTSSSDSLETGSHVMLAGIVFQFVCVIVYAFFLVDVCRRYYTYSPIKKSRSDSEGSGIGMDSPIEQKKLMGMFSMLSITTLFVVIRSIYRIVELSDGWNGKVMSTQVYFDVLDGAMLIIALAFSTFLHPGFLEPKFAMSPQEVQRLSTEGLPLEAKQQYV